MDTEKLKLRADLDALAKRVDALERQMATSVTSPAPKKKAKA